MLLNKVDSLREQFVTLSLPIQPVTGQNGTDKMSRTKWYRQNVTDKMVAVSTDLNSIELNIYLVTTSYK